MALGFVGFTTWSAALAVSGILRWQHGNCMTSLLPSLLSFRTPSSARLYFVALLEGDGAVMRGTVFELTNSFILLLMNNLKWF
jgi:hypothetical protein